MTPTTATATTAPEPVLRVSDVARHLDCDESTVYALISRDRLRAVRVGRLLRVPESALQEFIAGTTAH